MELTKDYLYKNDKVVLLVCDFYETTQIPQSMFDIKTNLAMFPIANLPVIDYILKSLSDQNLKNVILAGKNLDSILKYLQTTVYLSTLNIRTLLGNHGSMGDILRGLYDIGFEFSDLIVMYANHYTNAPIGKVLKRHKKNKNYPITIFLHGTNSNDINTHIYAIHDSHLVHYQKSNDGTINSADLMDAAKPYKTIEINTSYSAPTIAVISNQIFHLFSENFDFANFGDFLQGVLASPIYNFQIKVITENDLKKTSDFKLETEIVTQLFDTPYSSLVAENLYSTDNKDNFYSLEINTLLDYYKMNSEVATKGISTFKLSKSPECIKGNIKDTITVLNSFVGEKSYIEANLNNCIVWENCTVKEDGNDLIFFEDGKSFTAFHLEVEPAVLSSDNETVMKPTNDTFFDDFLDFMVSSMRNSKIYDVNLNSILKQINLLRIVWNASRDELIEAFALFFSEKLDLDSLEESISRISIFFGILAEFIISEQDEIFLMSCIYENLRDLGINDTVRAQIFFSFAFLFVESNIVEKPIVKKYNKMHKEGIF